MLIEDLYHQIVPPSGIDWKEDGPVCVQQIPKSLDDLDYSAFDSNKAKKTAVVVV
jgi:hypothetical protein